MRKLFNCGAFLSQTIFMMVAAYTMSSWAIVLCITIAVGLGGFAWSAFRYVLQIQEDPYKNFIELPSSNEIII